MFFSFKHRKTVIIRWLDSLIGTLCIEGLKPVQKEQGTGKMGV
jgi:hypothetical protein